MTLIPYTPNADCTRTQEQNRRIAVFGDGYQQASRSGRKQSIKTWSATFSNFTADTLNDFLQILRAAKGTGPVQWQSPMDNEPQNYLVKSWTTNGLSGKVYEVTVEMEEFVESVFTPEPSACDPPPPSGDVGPLRGVGYFVYPLPDPDFSEYRVYLLFDRPEPLLLLTFSGQTNPFSENGAIRDVDFNARVTNKGADIGDWEVDLFIAKEITDSTINTRINVSNGRRQERLFYTFVGNGESFTTITYPEMSNINDGFASGPTANRYMSLPAREIAFAFRNMNTVEQNVAFFNSGTFDSSLPGSPSPKWETIETIPDAAGDILRQRITTTWLEWYGFNQGNNAILTSSPTHGDGKFERLFRSSPYLEDVDLVYYHRSGTWENGALRYWDSIHRFQETRIGVSGPPLEMPWTGGTQWSGRVRREQTTEWFDGRFFTQPDETTFNLIGSPHPAFPSYPTYPNHTINDNSSYLEFDPIWGSNTNRVSVENYEYVLINEVRLDSCIPELTEGWWNNFEYMFNSFVDKGVRDMDFYYIPYWTGDYSEWGFIYDLINGTAATANATVRLASTVSNEIVDTGQSWNFTLDAITVPNFASSTNWDVVTCVPNHFVFDV